MSSRTSHIFHLIKHATQKYGEIQWTLLGKSLSILRGRASKLVSAETFLRRACQDLLMNKASVAEELRSSAFSRCL